MTIPQNKQRVPGNQGTPFTRCENTPEAHRAELISHLQTALILEHATIPPYLCALYSIRDGTNPAATKAIRSVALEEMLHMALVANLLNAIGGTPDMTRADFVPEYPDYLPHSDQSVLVSLNRFSPEALKVFLDIEQPRDPMLPPKYEDYSSIGQFYAAIKDELDYFCLNFDEDLFIGDPALQVSPVEYYSGGGEIIPVTNFESARRAIKVIVDEGEGFAHSIFSGDHEQFGEQPDLAHYYKFNEIAVGKRYLSTDSPAKNPTGPAVHVDFSDESVLPVVFPKRISNYPKPVRKQIQRFIQTYSELIRAIEGGFTETHGERKTQHFQNAVTLMFEVKYQMIGLMKVPIDRDGNTAGPMFAYVSP